MSHLLQCISPINGAIYAERQTQDYPAALASTLRAREAQRAWAAVPLELRIAKVNAAIAELGTHNDAIVTELAWMMGRPIRYGGEYKVVQERSTAMAHIAESSLQPLVVEDKPNVRRYIQRAPHGVVLVIAPWNYPYMTTINALVPALIAGNAVIMKHATQTLLVGERLEDAFRSSGIPEGLVQNLYINHQVAQQLITQRAFDYINFTGSVAGGAAIERAAAGTFVNVATELGGKDPGYVMEDAPLDTAVETLIDAAMFNSGQCCCGIERIYVHRSLFDRFVEKSVALVNSYKLGNPLDSATTMGPMAHTRFAMEVRSQIDEAVEAGATALLTPSTEDDGAAYLSPQILINVNHTMRIMREESFGPVIGIMPVDNDDQAISLINDSEFGLTASLWTQDINRAVQLGNRIETGTVFMNKADYLDPNLCWTGCKNTGKGASLSPLGFHALTRPKSFYLTKVTP